MTLRVTPDSSKSSKRRCIEDLSPWNFSRRPLTPTSRPTTPDAWTPWTPHSEPTPKNQLGNQASASRTKMKCETKEEDSLGCPVTPTRPYTKRRRPQQACAEDGGAIAAYLGTSASIGDRRRDLLQFLLEQLPEDAPSDNHQAHQRCYATSDHGRKLVRFDYTRNRCRMSIRIPCSKCGGFEEAALRIARICYMKAVSGASTMEVRGLLAELLAKIATAIETQSKDPMTPLKTPNAFVDRARTPIPPVPIAEDARTAAEEQLTADASAEKDSTVENPSAASLPGVRTLSKALAGTKTSAKAQRALTRRRPKPPTPFAAYKRVNKGLLPFCSPAEPSTPGSSLPPTPATMHPSPAASSPSTCVAVSSQILQEVTKIWWSCSQCSFHIPTTWTLEKRRGFKMFHMLGHGYGMKSTRKHRTRQGMLRAVWRGSFKKSQGNCKITKDKLRVNAMGRLVPKKRSEHCRKIAINSGWTRRMQCWKRASKHVYMTEGVTGFMKLKKNGTAVEQLRYKQVYEAFQEELARTPEPEPIGPKQQKITGFLVSLKKESASEVAVE